MTEGPHGRLFAPAGEDAVDDEFEFHLAERAAELEAEGLDAELALAEARRRFGPVKGVRDQCLELQQEGRVKRRRRQRIAELYSDLRGALRSLTRQWRYSLVVILVLGTAVGGSVAIGSLTRQLLLVPLPYEDPERLVVVWQNDRASGTRREPASIPDFFDVQDRTRTLEAVAAYLQTEGNLAHGDAEPRRVQAVTVSHGLLRALGREPLLGRSFTTDETSPSGPAVCLLGERLWTEVYERSESVLGETARFDEGPCVIVGVAPGDLELPNWEADLWLPLQDDVTTAPRWNHGTLVIARLADSASLEAAQEEMTAIHADLEREYPQSNTDRGSFVEPLNEVLRGEVRPTLLALCSAVVLLLIVALANVANLTILRLDRLHAELSIRAALGASRARLLLGFGLQAIALSGGIALAAWGAFRAVEMGVLRWVPSELLIGRSPRWDSGTVVLGLALVVGAAVFLWLVPLIGLRGFKISGLGLGTRVRGGPKPMTSAILITLQIALALPLLLGTVVLHTSLRNLARVDLGFEPQNVLRMSFALPQSRYPTDFANYPNWNEIQRFNRSLLDGVTALPGVESAALATNHPLERGFTNSFRVVGRAENDPVHQVGEIKVRITSPEYFDTNRVQLLDGRLFSSADGPDRPGVALLGEYASRRLFPEGSALGQRIAFWGIEREIVGIVADERSDGIDQEAPFAMYVSLIQAPQRGTATLMVRLEGEDTEGSSASQSAPSIAGSVREIVRRIDPQIALFDVASMSETVSASLADRRLARVLFVAFASLSLLLAGMGIYTVSSALVARRRHEIGVRMALGAAPAAVTRSVLGRGLRIALVGSAVGLALSALVLRSLQSLLFSVGLLDVQLLSLTLMAVALLVIVSSWIPARRAGSVDPASTLATQ